MISAKVVADSTTHSGKRIITFLLEYPRFIHAEFMTHRMFSRNAASSRAIPVAKMIERVKNDPAMPIFWGKNQKGMQAAEELEDFEPELMYDADGKPSYLKCSPRAQAKRYWLEARDQALIYVQTLQALDLHKQLANRLLEPWMHIAVLATATERGNFYNLRYHPMAQPEFQELAKCMYEAEQASEPTVLKVNGWHLPFVSPEEEDQLQSWAATVAGRGGTPIEYLAQKVSTARCARLSYYNVDGTSSSIEADLATYEKLMGGFPKHASPSEHQAMVADRSDGQSGNFFGWIQYRKLIEGENLPEFKGPTHV